MKDRLRKKLWKKRHGYCYYCVTDPTGKIIKAYKAKFGPPPRYPEKPPWKQKLKMHIYEINSRETKE